MPPREKFKVVHAGESSWVKVQQDDGKVTRHFVQQGPRGGKYFDDGERKRWVTQIPHHVNAYEEDHHRTPQKPYADSFGNTMADKRK